MTQKVVHVIPYDGIGGVEIAAASLSAGQHGPLHFAKCFLARKNSDIGANTRDTWTGPKASEYALQNFLTAALHLRQQKPDLVIVSLWRSCIAVLLAKLLWPRLRLVAFLHLAETVHLPDRVLNAIMMRLACEIWADSQATLDTRVPAKLRHRGRVISFLTDHVPAPPPKSVSPRFIFWGRLHSQKGLDTAIILFNEITKTHPNARFSIVGPDMGAKPALEELIQTLGLQENVIFHGPMERHKIFEMAQDYSFYLQASLTEGMAMSVIEAMQLGVIPVVTPVGEIANYCQDGQNAVLISKEAAQDCQKILSVLQDEAHAAQLATSAQNTWHSYPLYRDDVLQACHKILALI